MLNNDTHNSDGCANSINACVQCKCEIHLSGNEPI